MTTHNRPDTDTFSALADIVEALDKRFPDGNGIFQRVSRLAEECGELAAAVNHRENMGLKADKHGAATDEHLVKEIQDVMRAALGIAKHYDLEGEVATSTQGFHRAYREPGYLGY